MAKKIIGRGPSATTAPGCVPTSSVHIAPVRPPLGRRIREQFLRNVTTVCRQRPEPPTAAVSLVGRRRALLVARDWDFFGVQGRAQAMQCLTRVSAAMKISVDDVPLPHWLGRKNIMVGATTDEFIWHMAQLSGLAQAQIAGRSLFSVLGRAVVTQIIHEQLLSRLQDAISCHALPGVSLLEWLGECAPTDVGQLVRFFKNYLTVHLLRNALSERLVVLDPAAFCALLRTTSREEFPQRLWTAYTLRAPANECVDVLMRQLPTELRSAEMRDVLLQVAEIRTADDTLCAALGLPGGWPVDSLSAREALDVFNHLLQLRDEHGAALLIHRFRHREDAFLVEVGFDDPAAQQNTVTPPLIVPSSE